MTSVDQEAMRVANRYAATVAKAETLAGRARACRDAAEQYRRDARANQASAEQHQVAARTIRETTIAAEHARTAREAEAEAAREILAAHYYEAQAEQYDGQIPAGATTGGGTITRQEISMGDGTTAAAAASTSTTVPDVLGYADGETCHGTDQVPAVAGPGTVLALMDYGDGGDRWDGGRYVAVGTSPHRWNPVTNLEQADSGPSAGYAAPHLDPAEAEAAAAHLDELADLAEAGHRPPTPTKWSRAAQRLEHLLAGDADLAGEKVRIVDDELPVTMKDLLALLRDKQPTTAAATRRHVAATAIDQAGGDTGTLWLDLVDHDDTTHIAVAGVEGTEDPDDDFWQPYTARHTPAQARELAGKLRTFAASARDSHDIEPGARTPLPDGGRQLEMGGPGGQAVAIELNRPQLVALDEQLHADLTNDRP
jgi:hypothetical protein